MLPFEPLLTKRASSMTNANNCSGRSTKPHAVCISYPAQGHINALFKFAKILHSRGFHITFVHTEYNYRRLLNSRGPNSLDGLPSFRFRTIPDGLPPSQAADVTQDIPSFCRSILTNFFQPFKELVQSLNRCAVDAAREADSAPTAPPPVTAIITDPVMCFALDVGHDLGIPVVALWTASACGLLGYAQYTPLIEQGIVPFKDSNFMTDGSLEASFDWIPMKGIRLKDLPSFIRTTDGDDILLNFLITAVDTICKYSVPVLLNTFDALEQDSLNEISKFVPGPLLSIGPMHLQLDHDHETKIVPLIGSNLRKEDPECLHWLDSKKPKSVVYVNYGSITVMTNKQLTEFAWGLANSKKPFLWVIRPDLVSGESAVLPPEFAEEIRGRGRVATWCDQEQVLRHPSVGAFLTHSGWNSTLDAIVNGVPVLSWPFFAEQQTNCWYSYNEWGIGMEIDNDVKRDEVERQVIELMDGDKGKKMKRRAMEWKSMAYEAVNLSSGSSRLNLDRLINQLLP